MNAQRKRKRSLSVDPSPSSAEADPGLTQSAELYFDDGNIVLIAENIAFRVYRGLLARHSAVFRDMFLVVNQPANGETFDGCPTVRLSDTSCDITMLLCALYDTPHFTARNAEGVQVLTSVLRIATKYLMDPLRDTCIKALCESYPDTLAQWDCFDGVHFWPDRVVQLIDADILLPSAYYALCRRSWDSLPSAEDKLPLHVLEAYCKGKERMAKSFVSFFEGHIAVDAIFAHVRPRCESDDCKSVWEGLRTRAVLKLGSSYEVIHPDPLHILQQLQEDPRIQCEGHMCHPCRSHLRRLIRRAREGQDCVYGSHSRKCLGWGRGENCGSHMMIHIPHSMITMSERLIRGFRNALFFLDLLDRQ